MEILSPILLGLACSEFSSRVEYIVSRFPWGSMILLDKVRKARFFCNYCSD